MTAGRRGVMALAAACLLAGCAPSAADELTRRIQDAGPTDGYRVTVAFPDPSTLLQCFPDSGSLTIDVGKESISVYDDPAADPVLIVTGRDITLRPSAFSSGPEEWWSFEASTNLEPVRRVVGPVVAELVLGEGVDRPDRLLTDLVESADLVDRLGGDRFRVVDRHAEPTVLDVTLDPHDHLRQLDVAAEDPERPGQPDALQTSYTASYRDGATPTRFEPSGVRRVEAGRLDTLDNRPGACSPVVAP